MSVKGARSGNRAIEILIVDQTAVCVERMLLKVVWNHRVRDIVNGTRRNRPNLYESCDAAAGELWQNKLVFWRDT